MNITKIRNAAPNTTLWDDEIKGLHLRSRTSGKKSFMVFYRTKSGVQRRPKLGEFGDITLAEARKRAKLILDRVAIGEDPKGEWNEAKAEMTVRELYHLTVKEYWSEDRFERSGWKYNLDNLYKNHIEPNFGSQKISEVTVMSIRRWHGTFKKTPYAGNRSLDVLSKMFNFAEQEGFRTQGTNPCKLVKAFQEKKRKRFATIEEFKKITEILDREAVKHPNAVAFLYVLIFTGSRPRAIERAMPNQLKRINLKGEIYGELTFKGKSSSEDETLILPPQAMKHIDALPRRIHGTLLNIKMPRNLWRKVREEAKCEDLWVRDFRRLFASTGKSCGIDMGTIGDLLNHKSAQTTKIYAHLFDERRIEAVGKIANRLLEMKEI